MPDSINVTVTVPAPPPATVTIVMDMDDAKILRRYLSVIDGTVHPFAQRLYSALVNAGVPNEFSYGPGFSIPALAGLLDPVVRFTDLEDNR